MEKFERHYYSFKMRTLHLRGLDVLVNFQCPFVLIVEDENAKELPNWIGKLKRLRLLDITYCVGINLIYVEYSRKGNKNGEWSRKESNN